MMWVADTISRTGRSAAGDPSTCGTIFDFQKMTWSRERFRRFRAVERLMLEARYARCNAHGTVIWGAERGPPPCSTSVVLSPACIGMRKPQTNVSDRAKMAPRLNNGRGLDGERRVSDWPV